MTTEVSLIAQSIEYQGLNVEGRCFLLSVSYLLQLHDFTALGDSFTKRFISWIIIDQRHCIELNALSLHDDVISQYYDII